MTVPALLLIWLIGLISPSGPAAAGEPDLAALLPRAGEAEGWRRTERLDRAQGEELFALINGGAELFLRHGFRGYVATEYLDPGGVSISLELYRMADPEGARRVFGLKAGADLEKVEVGEEAAQGDYYLLFRAGRVLAVLVGPDSRQETRRGLLTLARAAARRIGKGD